jgi:hypothetical protein
MNYSSVLTSSKARIAGALRAVPSTANCEP